MTMMVVLKVCPPQCLKHCHAHAGLTSKHKSAKSFTKEKKSFFEKLKKSNHTHMVSRTCSLLKLPQIVLHRGPLSTPCEWTCTSPACI